MKVVIAGAGGYLGEHIVQASLAEGHEVTAMVRRGSGVQFPGRVRRLEGDLGDHAHVACALADAEGKPFD
jgi:putative NADH-flavin reductase